MKSFFQDFEGTLHNLN